MSEANKNKEVQPEKSAVELAVIHENGIVSSIITNLNLVDNTQVAKIGALESEIKAIEDEMLTAIYSSVYDKSIYNYIRDEFQEATKTEKLPNGMVLSMKNKAILELIVKECIGEEQLKDVKVLKRVKTILENSDLLLKYNLKKWIKTDTVEGGSRVTTPSSDLLILGDKLLTKIKRIQTVNTPKVVNNVPQTVHNPIMLDGHILGVNQLKKVIEATPENGLVELYDSLVDSIAQHELETQSKKQFGAIVKDYKEEDYSKLVKIFESGLTLDKIVELTQPQTKEDKGA